MKEYDYIDIVCIDENGIKFKDNFHIDFEKCRKEWAKVNNILMERTKCVAVRFVSRKERYFIFYAEEKVKLTFRFKGILGVKKRNKRFREIQMVLEHYGYGTYDMS